MQIIPSLRAWVTAFGSLLLCGALQAAPVWQQYDELTGVLDNNFSTELLGSVARVNFSQQTVTNTGAQDGHLGMYFGWSWMRPTATAVYEALPWDNASQRFRNAHVAMQVEYLGQPDAFLRAGDVLDDSWVGVPWTPGGSAAAIATEADWVLPLFDFGDIAAGASKSYDLRFSFEFANDVAAAEFLRAGAFQSYSQGVIQRVPEPTSLLLVALALAALVPVTRLTAARSSRVQPAARAG